MNAPIPIQLAKAALHAGMVVPVITLRHLDGAPEFGMVDHDKLTACLIGRLCQLCGARLQDVEPIDRTAAKAFVRQHHYSSSWPAAIHQHGMFDHLDPAWPRLVGVAVGLVHADQ
ncbi:hypothetical protein [Nonomuraea sp. NPDC048916]|uniref:hypothetical protein n=1 Tax=Nonomuraea sp. NPDC048916 TaxID=3154232 RepID=UPI0033FDDFC5